MFRTMQSVRRLIQLCGEGVRSDDELSEMNVVVPGSVGLCMPNGVGYGESFAGSYLQKPKSAQPTTPSRDRHILWQQEGDATPEEGAIPSATQFVGMLLEKLEGPSDAAHAHVGEVLHDVVLRANERDAKAAGGGQNYDSDDDDYMVSLPGSDSVQTSAPGGQTAGAAVAPAPEVELLRVLQSESVCARLLAVLLDGDAPRTAAAAAARVLLAVLKRVRATSAARAVVAAAEGASEGSAAANADSTPDGAEADGANAAPPTVVLCVIGRMEQLVAGLRRPDSSGAGNEEPRSTDTTYGERREMLGARRLLLAELAGAVCTSGVRIGALSPHVICLLCCPPCLLSPRLPPLPPHAFVAPPLQASATVATFVVTMHSFHMDCMWACCVRVTRRCAFHTPHRVKRLPTSSG
jgi:hypothetical protein